MEVVEVDVITSNAVLLASRIRTFAQDCEMNISRFLWVDECPGLTKGSSVLPSEFNSSLHKGMLAAVYKLSMVVIAVARQVISAK